MIPAQTSLYSKSKKIGYSRNKNIEEVSLGIFSLKTISNNVVETHLKFVEPTT